MYEIKQIADYRQLAKILEAEVDCSVKIKIMGSGTSHIHYQINDKYDMALGILCIDNGNVSFAPFVTHENAENNQYINVQYMAQFDDFIKLLRIFKKMFVVEQEQE